MEQQTTTFSISDLAREFHITPRTIRFYEDQGLLAPRREGRTRVFTRRDRTRLKLALRGKRLGFSLAEIAYLIGMYDTARDKNTQLTEFLNGLEQRKAALLQQREDIEVVLQEVCNFEEQCRQLLLARAASKSATEAAREAAKANKVA
ncbi:MerR family DNA-binding transcriptional regulator [Accumulibacter sp.]|uniref:MerR family transcriptional regulator n=1 Tax=Accumulibacter sp. TaxID=2053492 RepID=UPI0028C4AD42|nr:MerR family DNA-binding transcriptional regulator [Accumulibacter sp.]